MVCRRRRAEGTQFLSAKNKPYNYRLHASLMLAWKSVDTKLAHHSNNSRNRYREKARKNIKHFIFKLLQLLKK